MGLRTLRAAVLAVALLILGPAGHALAGEITNSSEDLRTGWYPAESAITPGLVTGGTFGQEWSTPVTGQVYAQPLLDGATVLVATEENDVYALNASNGEVEWEKYLGAPPWNPEEKEVECSDLEPKVGVTSTPVIDTATGVAYMTHKTGAGTGTQWYMDAIEMASGAEKPGFPVLLAGRSQNNGEEFNARYELQRPGLLLMEGVVYAAFGSDCDAGSYKGWIFGVSEAGALKVRWTDERYAGSGIWQSGAGLMSDGPGTIVFATGNGSTPTPGTPGNQPPETLGESVVRVRVEKEGENLQLEPTDFFAPYDAESLSKNDADFASGGVTGLPPEYFGTTSVPHIAVAVGKDGYVYLLNLEHLGGIGEGKNGGDDVVQKIGPYGGVWSRPGVWPGEGGWVYIPTASNGESSSGSAGNLRVYSYGVSGENKPTLALQGTSSEEFGFGSGAPIITSAGTQSGSAVVWIEWAANGGGEGAQLRAYAAKPAYNSTTRKVEPVLLDSWPIGRSAKFATPGIGGGRVFVGTRDGHVIAFGSPVSAPLTAPPTEFQTTTLGSHTERTATLTATREVTITGLQTSPSPEFEMAPQPGLPVTLAQGETLAVPVRFTPGSTGPRGGTLTATLSNGEKVPFSLAGTGQASGPLLEGSPTVITFGGTSPGGSLSATATFRNVGSSNLEIQSVVTPGSPFHAEGVPAPGTEIEPQHSVTIPIDFEPTADGQYEEAIKVESTGGTIELHMTGTSAPPGVLAIEPEERTFGEVAVGGEATRSFVVADTGGSPITIYKSKPPTTEGGFEAVSEPPRGQRDRPRRTPRRDRPIRPEGDGARERRVDHQR